MMATLTLLYLAKLINSAIRLQYIPNAWKIAKIILILKPGKAADKVDSYGPISLLPIASKVFERVIQARLDEIIHAKRLLPDTQFGFRNKYGTIEQTHRLVNDINSAFENRAYCPAVFLDIARAIDKVWHAGLLHKLEKNLPGPVCHLMKSYLTVRYFSARVGNSYSNPTLIRAGVPQGSVIGPTFYLLYTADIPNCDDTFTALFADDTVVAARHNNYAKAVLKLQNSLNDIYSWAKQWKIAINKNKSVKVDFALRTHNNLPSLLLSGSQTKK